MAIMAKRQTQTMAELEQGLFTEITQPDPKPQPKPESPKPQPPEPETPKPEPNPEPKPKKPLPKWLIPALAAVVLVAGIGIGIKVTQPTRDYKTAQLSLAAGSLHTVGLRSDGTLVARGKNDDGRCNVSSWADIRTP